MIAAHTSTSRQTLSTLRTGIEIRYGMMRTMKVYEVGGAVRDALLGLPVKERDWVVVGASADELAAQGYRRVGL